MPGMPQMMPMPLAQSLVPQPDLSASLSAALRAHQAPSSGLQSQLLASLTKHEPADGSRETPRPESVGLRRRRRGGSSSERCRPPARLAMGSFRRGSQPLAQGPKAPKAMKWQAALACLVLPAAGLVHVAPTYAPAPQRPPWLRPLLGERIAAMGQHERHAMLGMPHDV